MLMAMVQMAVGMVVARAPEYAALKLSGVAVATRRAFAVPAFVLGLPAALAARSIRWVTPEPETDILALVEKEEAEGGVEEQERRMIRGSSRSRTRRRGRSWCRGSTWRRRRSARRSAMSPPS
ncbi:hypothetical protein O0235_01775 [Tepidiforma flava]|uniref:Uncharacterized protein n=1 Tax=Tepidiforma flava TaxID=3004094 RepID=A0ABY7M7R3_9CHLR|nr:hypothetical protein [Tepidiforma flava]WBL36332.1 hypothetical protein O0235_01775 [Tepidiforma flava]